MTLYRLPAEWENQSGIQLTWPNQNNEWGNSIDQAEKCLSQIAKEISYREKLLIVCEDKKRVISLMVKAEADLNNIVFVELNNNDIWARDHAAITVYETKSGKPKLLDFSFNGWGLKYVANFDNQISRNLYKKRIFKNASFETINLVLEGGSIEANGKGIILTTSQCLLSPNRNPSLSKSALEEQFSQYFGTQKVLWLDYGYMSGDDTDSHIDTLARFYNENGIVYMSSDKPTDEHYEELKLMEEQLKTFTNLQGQSFELKPLFLPKPVLDQQNNRMPATYANFLIINKAVLMPIYGDPEKDEMAFNTLQTCFPERQIITIDCRALILQYGSLHCATMQYPYGINW